MRLFRTTAAAAGFIAVLSAEGSLRPTGDTGAKPPEGEVLSYTVEWRFIHAGNVRLTWSPEGGGWAARLRLESAGMVSRFYAVDDLYTSLVDQQLCADSLSLKSNEGSRRHETSVTFDSVRRKASYRDNDLVSNTVVTHETDIPPCAHDVIGALYALRRQRFEPGRSLEIPVSDGKKTVTAKVEVQERETIKTDAGTYKTIRCEAFLFNNVLYRRRGRLFVWFTDDERHVPVQIRIRMPFYVGTVTLQLAKEGEK
jgi:hypothetical protein